MSRARDHRQTKRQHDTINACGERMNKRWNQRTHARNLTASLSASRLCVSRCRALTAGKKNKITPALNRPPETLSDGILGRQEGSAGLRSVTSPSPRTHVGLCQWRSEGGGRFGCSLQRSWLNTKRIFRLVHFHNKHKRKTGTKVMNLALSIINTRPPSLADPPPAAC